MFSAAPGVTGATSLGIDIIVVETIMTIKRASGGGIESGTQTDDNSAAQESQEQGVNFDAYSAHLRNVRSRVYEPIRNIWDNQLKMPTVFHEMPKIQLQPKTEDWKDAQDEDGEGTGSSACAVSAVPSARLLSKSTQKIPWTKKLADHRMAGIKKWVALIEKYPKSFQCGKQWMDDFQCDLGDVVMDVLSKKATSTIHDRAGPLLRYVYWCKQKGMLPFPFVEKSLYAFVNEVGKQAAPTFARSFLCSVAFAGHIMGAESALVVLESKRLTGAAAKFFSEKRKLCQKPPLTVAQVKILEDIVCGKLNRKLPDRVAAGFFMWLIAARARFSDGQNSGILTLDTCMTPDGVTGYAEANVVRTKSSMTLERKTRFLPMAGAIRVFSKDPWAFHYMQAIKDSGLSMGSDRPLLPSPSETGWGSLPISAEAATSWLKSLLTIGGCSADEVKNLGTHSCKVTALSWCAKAGLSKEVRAILGYHSPKGSVMVYGRDNQAEPLRQLDGIFRKIAMDEFFPDATRSGYLVKKDGDDNPVEDDSSSSTSSEDSMDEENPEHEAQEEATDGVVGQWNAGYKDDKLESMSFFRHAMSRVIHVIADEGGTHLLCGRPVSTHFTKLSRKPVVMNPLCKQCFANFIKDR